MQEQIFGESPDNERPLMRSMARGFMGRCPHCGQGRLFGKFLKVVDCCDMCSENYHHHRADDLPAYLVIFIIGHIVVGAFMGMERIVDFSPWLHLAIWVPLTLILSIVLLQPMKGLVVGLQWALKMHGFSGNEDPLETHPEL